MKIGEITKLVLKHSLQKEAKLSIVARMNFLDKTFDGLEVAEEAAVLCDHLYLLPLIPADLVPPVWGQQGAAAPALAPQPLPHPHDVPRLGLGADHVGQGQPPALKYSSLGVAKKLAIPRLKNTPRAWDT